MKEKSPELKVISYNGRGRRRYDKASKRALVEACLSAGVSIARQAQQSGVHVSLLRKWIAQYLLERERTMPIDALAAQPGAALPAMLQDPVPTNGISEVQGSANASSSAFVAVIPAPTTTTTTTLPEPALPCEGIALHVRLPNGVAFDVGKVRLETLTAMVQMLGRMSCSDSTTG